MYCEFDRSISDARALNAIHDWQDSMEAAEQVMAREFIELVMKGDMSAPATFAMQLTDYNAPAKTKRYQTTLEVMEEAVSYGDGASMSDVMSLLVNVAQGIPLQQAAKELIKRMAYKFADFNAGVDE